MPESTLFANNIFYIEEKLIYILKEITKQPLATIVFFGEFENLKDDPTAMFENPDIGVHQD